MVIVMKRLISKVHKIIDYGSTALTVVCCIFVILWGVDPVRNYLISKNIFSTESYIGFVSSILILSIGLLWSIKNKIGSIDKTMESTIVNTIDKKNIIIEEGVHEVYPMLDNLLNSSTNTDESELDIIGTTLYTAWPHIHPWILKNTTVNWSINLFLLDPSYITQEESLFHKDWANTSRDIIDNISSVCNISKEQLVHRKIKIKLFTYSYFPAVRGFRVNGNLLLTYSHWDKNGLADYPHYFYEYFDVNDKSARAECYKNHYNNTFDFYKKNAQCINEWPPQI